jgi:uncharacterized protein YfiM (DUF2279 family)
VKGLLLALALHGPGDHPGGDRWFAPDKVKHFFLGAFVQSVGYAGLRATGTGHESSLWGATAVTVAIGVGKEVHDARGGGSASVRDLVWDAAGAGGATLLLQRTRP